MIARDKLVEALKVHEAEIVEAEERRPLAEHVLALLEKAQTHTEWTPAQIDSINYEMAEGIIQEIRQTLEDLGCLHGHNMENAPPMFYREAILCAVAKARMDYANELIDVIKKHVKSGACHGDEEAS